MPKEPACWEACATWRYVALRGVTLPMPFTVGRLQGMDFSIITPSFRNSEWLKLCVQSVADQRGVTLEHIVQDACSDDGTQTWLPSDPRVKAFIEKDDGMYDAINRGLRRAQGNFLAYLNCDEQYLPGALQTVRTFFERHPETDVVFAGAVVADGQGNYLCHRHALKPTPQQIWFRFSALTCAIFFRRKVIDSLGVFFDTKYRAVGDFHWVRALMQAGARVAVLDEFTSLFTDDGKNLCLSPRGRAEMDDITCMTPGWLKATKPLWIGLHRWRRLQAGHFTMKPTQYEIYTPTSPTQRVTIAVPHPTGVWKNRM
jgi:hypothetical protein